VKNNRNFLGFIWHAFWLALAETFAEKNTVLPGLILLGGGTQFDVGILTSIVIGVPLISQLAFASYLTNRELKKNFLLFGIYLRVSAFIGVAVSIYFFEYFSETTFVLVIFIWMSLFSLSGAFAGVSYTDIIGKSFNTDERKKFFVFRQFISGVGILISAVIVKEILSSVSYPQNYQVAFFMAGALLFVASMGFVVLKEKPSQISQRYNTFIDVIKTIPTEIKKSSNLKNFVITTNLIGFTFVLIPFYVGYIKNSFVLNKEVIGWFLLIQIIGIIFSNIIWHKLVKRFSFKGMLRVDILINAVLPPIALVLGLLENMTMFYILFFFNGFAISAHKISLEGVMVEISNESNRPLYTGIFGTFNLVSMIIPLLIGTFLVNVGYTFLFVVLPFISLSAVHFVNKMICPIDLERLNN